ncbi:MAG TPA: tyrosine-type recombinase/integrase [Leptospiraceae bacterium]|nr:tyrosine-type recombinase/integrase [Leptospiraceae bacterium]HMY65059.1 tyrosine-type recombinase/integrase [Leptospiraceae bacterium]HNF16568.1 tyrosine-type recombinase/integrase [Leptospiraceae bacterium]HNF23343.1 tyrosine-type recombinase/integrase [Leptospiraceae bacterium]HNH08290.1 tyrosine-type recombinase/integrase [Leptospiraceae bacterium]
MMNEPEKKQKKTIFEDEVFTKKQIMEFSKVVKVIHSYNDDKEDYRWDLLSCFVQALFWTGCRISELVKVTYEDIEEIMKNDIFLKVHISGKRERSVLMPKSLLTEIRLITKKEIGYLFQSRQGLPFKKDSVFRELGKIRRELTDRDIYTDIFKHSRAMHLYRLTKDLKLIQKYLGNPRKNFYEFVFSEKPENRGKYVLQVFRKDKLVSIQRFETSEERAEAKAELKALKNHYKFISGKDE